MARPWDRTEFPFVPPVGWARSHIVYLTTAQVARRMQFRSRRAIANAIRRGELPGFKIAGQWRIPAKILEETLAERSQFGRMKGIGSDGV